MSLRLKSLDEVPGACRVVPDGPQVHKPFIHGTRESVNAAPTKYFNRKCEEDGERFDSKLELRYHRELKLRKAAGEVRWWARQVGFQLEGGVRYRADFVVALTAGGTDVIDCKGHDTPASRNKRKQMLARHGIVVQLWPTR
jgi:hypothetical protein